jgi:NADH dehydrogenase [ubiquinone] 1 alpha subcomplex assembly factor 2
MEEQRAELMRQERMKLLAAEADARWEAKPRVMEAPREEEAARRLPLAEERAQQPVEGEDKKTTTTTRKEKPSQAAKQEEKADTKDPWAKARAQGPGENWQPTAWNPTATAKKR